MGRARERKWDGDTEGKERGGGEERVAGEGNELLRT